MFYENDTAYFVMESIRGVTLKDFLIKRGSVLDIKECREMLLPVIHDLQGVHEKGIVHRDISLDNLMVREDGKVMLLDLGAAKDLTRGTGQSSFVVVKKGFSPPEQYMERGEIGPWTDVYAMCATIYWCMTGKLVPEAMERTMGEGIGFPDAFPSGMASVLRRGLAVRPADRIRDMGELEKEIERIKPPKEPKGIRENLQGCLNGLTKRPKTPGRDKPVQSGGIIFIAAAATVVIIAALAWFRGRPGETADLGTTADVTEGVSVESGKVTEAEQTREPARTSDEPMALTDSWEEIAEAGRDGTYRERSRIGDTKELDMGFEGIITMKLVAMDEDELADGSGKAPMTWVADELLQSEHNMNSKDTNEGGWEASEMRAWLREEVLSLMPEEVRSNIREVTKYSCSHEEQKGVASKDTIWIPSVREVFPAGYDDWTDKRREQEGVSYTSVIKDDESRMRSRDGESGASWWWLRSASITNSSYFSSVSGDGDYGYYYYADREGGVVVGFCF